MLEGLKTRFKKIHYTPRPLENACFGTADVPRRYPCGYSRYAVPQTPGPEGFHVFEDDSSKTKAHLKLYKNINVLHPSHTARCAHSHFVVI